MGKNTINLKKGQRVELTKSNPGLKKVAVQLGWKENVAPGHEFDLDASGIMLNANRLATSDKSFVFYHNPQSPCRSVFSSGDNRTGAGESEVKEQLTVELAKVPTDIQAITFIASIYDAEERDQSFGMVSEAFIQVVDMSTNDILMRYNLTEDFSLETAVVMGEIYRHDDEWKFNAIGNGYTTGLVGVLNSFGL